MKAIPPGVGGAKLKYNYIHSIHPINLLIINSKLKNLQVNVIQVQTTVAITVTILRSIAPFHHLINLSITKVVEGGGPLFFRHIGPEKLVIFCHLLWLCLCLSHLAADFGVTLLENLVY